MKLNEVKCPNTDGEDAPCESYEISFDRPLYKDRECEEVIIYGICDSCGGRVEVHGKVEVTTVERG